MFLEKLGFPLSAVETNTPCWPFSPQPCHTIQSLNGHAPFLSQSGDRRQEVVLGKLLFRSRREDRLPRRCKKSLARRLGGGGQEEKIEAEQLAALSSTGCCLPVSETSLQACLCSLPSELLRRHGHLANHIHCISPPARSINEATWSNQDILPLLPSSKLSDQRLFGKISIGGSIS